MLLKYVAPVFEVSVIELAGYTYMQLVVIHKSIYHYMNLSCKASSWATAIWIGISNSSDNVNMLYANYVYFNIQKVCA